MACVIRLPPNHAKRSRPNGATAMPELTKAKAQRQARFRVLPGKAGIWRYLETVLEDQRRLYNGALEERIDMYRKTGKGPSYYDQCKSLTECRREIPRMAETSMYVQRGTLKRLYLAFAAFFRRVKAGEKPGFPKFMGRRRWASFAAVDGVRLSGNRLHLPKFPPLVIRRKGGNLHAAGKIKGAVLKRERGKWYAVVCYEVDDDRTDDGAVLGVDVNVAQVTDSEGEIHRLPDMTDLDRRIRRQARRISRKRRGSRRRKKALKAQARLMRKRADKLKDWQHKVSRKLADKAGTVVWEDLKCAAMTRSAKGTVEAPGKNVAQKRGLNRSIRNTGWRGLRDKTEYKAFRTALVPAAYTSRTCNRCGHEEKRNRPARDRFECMACGHAEHADINAARNIADGSIRAASGIGVVTRGDHGASLTRLAPSGRGQPNRRSVAGTPGGFTYAEEVYNSQGA